MFKKLNDVLRKLASLAKQALMFPTIILQLMKAKQIKSQEKDEHIESVNLLRKKINSHLYVDVDYDEHAQIIYLMLNRASFAISLDEFAGFTSSINSAFNALLQHPNILLALEKDEETDEEKQSFVYVGEDIGDEFVN